MVRVLTCLMVSVMLLALPMAAQAQTEDAGPQAIPQPNELQAIPQPNEAASPAPVTQPVVPVIAQPTEATLIGPLRPANERFGGADGVLRIVVVGDTLAKSLGVGMERLTELDPRLEVVNRFNEASGVARPQVYNWPASLAKILKASSFDVVVVAMGVNDRQSIKVGDVKVEFGTPDWGLAYKRNVDAVLTAAKAGGARVYWLTLPPMQNPEFEQQMQVVASLQRERVVTANELLIDVRPPLTNPDGSFMLGDLDDKGKARRLRAKDGINFTRAGGDVLANMVLRAVRKGENVPELESTKDEDQPEEQQVAVAAPLANSPLFGQLGVDDTLVTFEADALSKEVPQQIAADLSNAGKLGLRIMRNSLAQRFYRTGEALGVPYGRFDDFSVGAAGQ